MFICKNGFGINILQWLMCHKTKPNQTRLFGLPRLKNQICPTIYPQLVGLGDEIHAFSKGVSEKRYTNRPPKMKRYYNQA